MRIFNVHTDRIYTRLCINGLTEVTFINSHLKKKNTYIYIYIQNSTSDHFIIRTSLFRLVPILNPEKRGGWVQRYALTCKSACLMVAAFQQETHGMMGSSFDEENSSLQPPFHSDHNRGSSLVCLHQSVT